MEMGSNVRPFQLYGEESASYVPDLVHLETIAMRASLHNWFIGAHRHPSILQLLYIERGEGVLVAEGGELPLELPSLVLMPCDCPHAFRFGPDAKGWVLSVADALFYDPRVTITDKDRFLQRAAVERIPLAAGDDSGRLIRLLFRDIERRRVDANIAVTDGVLAALSLLFSLAQEISAQPQEGALTPRRALFRRFMRMVEASFRDNLAVGDYADALGTSQATLARACREVTGKAPGALVNERRLLEARRSLSLTTASIKQIADDLGYDDPAYFARSFRRNTGATASEFRRNTMRRVPELDGAPGSRRR
jgi:AraC family transcriptional regulator, transcriptional activator of pobA